MKESGITDGPALLNLRTDNSVAKSLVSRTGLGRKARHLQMKYLYIQDIIQDGQVKIFKLGNHGNTADLMTMYFTCEATLKLSRMLGVHPLSEGYQL